MASMNKERQALLDAQKSHADEQKLARLARSNSVVRDLIDEVNRLRAENAALKAGKAKSK